MGDVNPPDETLRTPLTPPGVRARLLESVWGPGGILDMQSRAFTGSGSGDNADSCPFLAPLTRMLGARGIGGIFGQIANAYLQQLRQIIARAQGNPGA